MKKYAVFDIDGTLIRWQLYHAVVNELGKKGIIPEEKAKQIKQSRMRWKRRESDNAFHEYEMTLIELFESSLKSISPEDLDKTINEVAEEYKSQVYVYTRNLVNELKGKGYFMIAISGSHEEIIKHVAENYGFDDWVGSRHERDDEGFTGEKFVASLNKKQILNMLINKHNLSSEDSYGVGDTANDAPILEMVENPIAFNPNKALYELAKGKGWKIVIERKNVCYELTKNNSGAYVLS